MRRPNHCSSTVVAVSLRLTAIQNSVTAPDPFEPSGREAGTNMRKLELLNGYDRLGPAITDTVFANWGPCEQFHS
ncbi:hypothetical protein GPALN_014286 [Globodera pallida]|nr:hypothetical protein GPALN_014286 [Globodera pallida]